MSLQALRAGPKDRVPEIRNAYRFLRGAHDSVDGVLVSLGVLASWRRAGNASPTGRSHRDEVNLLRAAIVFTSSGLDASMKRLVNDAGRYLITRPTAPIKNGARATYEQFIREQLGAPGMDQGLKDAIVSSNSDEMLLNYYLATRSKASFQGSGDLEARVRNVLGIPKKRITQARLESLDEFFTVRNSIAHSMDYDVVGNSNSRARTHRRESDVVALCDNAFDVAADIMHAAGEVILQNR